MNADDTCQRCGENVETVNHLLFQCRVSREIWEHTLNQSATGKFIFQNSFSQNLESLQSFSKNQREDVSLFHFLGWRIWKVRNDLYFNNKQWSIPDTINKALLDYQQWKDSLTVNQVIPVEDITRDRNTPQNPLHIRNVFTDSGIKSKIMFVL